MKDPKYLNKACEAKYPPSFHRTDYDDKGFPIQKAPVFGLGGLGKRRGAVSSRMYRPTAETAATVARFKERLSLGLGTKQPQPAGVVPEKSNTTLQHLRDEVRSMTAAEKPLNGIPLYRGRPIDGDSGAFLRKHYGRYLLGADSDVLFASDLNEIDGRLLRALRFDFPGKSFPIGNKSDLINALAVGKFTDGANTTKRIKDALRLRGKLGIVKAY